MYVELIVIVLKRNTRRKLA